MDTRTIQTESAGHRLIKSHLRRFSYQEKAKDGGDVYDRLLMLEADIEEEARAGWLEARALWPSETDQLALEALVRLSIQAVRREAKHSDLSAETINRFFKQYDPKDLLR